MTDPKFSTETLEFMDLVGSAVEDERSKGNVREIDGKQFISVDLVGDFVKIQEANCATAAVQMLINSDTGADIRATAVNTVMWRAAVAYAAKGDLGLQKVKSEARPALEKMDGS